MSRIKRLTAFLIVAGYVMFYLPIDLAHGFWHTFRCEVAGREWRWVEYESQIGEDIYTFNHCSKCRYPQRVPSAYLGI